MRLVSRELFYPSPGKGVLVYGDSFYTRPSGGELIASRAVETRSDLIDSQEIRYSGDNGRSWGEPIQQKVVEKTERGMHRLFLMPGWVDPGSGRLLMMAIEGVLPADNALEDGMRHYYLRYRVSLDGGRSFVVDEQAMQRESSGGRRATPIEPFDGVTVGKNSMMLGDKGSMPLRTRGGRILVPVQVCPVGPDGEYHNPGGGYTYHDAAVLIGTWSGNRILWDLSQYVKADPARSTRGCIEPTLAELRDGSILMVLRGSNGGTKDPDHRIPGYRWYTISRDQGSSWDPVRPWTTTDGKTFFSPSSMSLLLRHSSGSILWIGNVSESNPRANSPRYPLCIGRVDSGSGLLETGSLVQIDTRESGEPPDMTLSNFSAREDRETGEIVLHMSRWMLPDWIGSAYLYRIEV